MKLKTLLVAIVALAAIVPAASFANPTTGQDRANGARACSALRTSLGASFALTYGTNASRSDAYGKCVSQWSQKAHQARHAAEVACASVSKQKGAFAKCVASKLAANVSSQVTATKNAAKVCKAERASLGNTAFATKYGTNANKSNAFGKCVSTRASAGSNGSGGSGGTQPQTTHYGVTLAASPLNGSTVGGTGTLTLKGDQLTVVLSLSGLEPNQAHAVTLRGLASGAAASCPTAASDTDKNGSISDSEAKVSTGDTIVSLGSVSTATATISQTFTIDPAKLGSLVNRVIVVQGLTVKGAYDATLPVACGAISSK